MGTTDRAPERIYLQTGCGEPECEDCPDFDEMTWCVDRIHEGDTEYVRADVVAALREYYDACEALRAPCNDLVEWRARVARLDAARRAVETGSCVHEG